MEQYDLMYNIVDNPESTVLDFRDAGFNAENTTLEDISVYLNDPYIKEQFTENGVFDEGAVREAYNNATIMYNVMAADLYDEYIQSQVPWGKYNNDVDYELRQKGPRYLHIESSNPDHITSSMIEIGQVGPRLFSREEYGQRSQTLKNPSEVFANGEDNPNWDVAIWDDSPNDSFFSNFFTPIVFAQYDSDGTHRDPISGELVEHKKGTPKLNPQGEYYYEYLDGRDIYGRQLLNKTDIITQDGSWLNQFDFFDCDDINQKSFTGTVMRNLALVGTMFIPGVGPWVTLLGMIPQLATMTAVLGKMIVGSDSPNLSALEGWGKSFDKFGASTEYAKEHPWCLENMINLMGMVAGQLQEQRMFFEYIPAIFKGGKNMYNETTYKNMLQKFAESEQQLFSKQASKLTELVKTGKASSDEIAALPRIQKALESSSVLKTYIENAAQARMSEFMKGYNRIGSIVSKGYMTILTVQDTYGEAKLAGASDLEAVALTLGYAAGEAWILNTGIGEWILPELRADRELNKQIIRTLLKDNMATVKQIEDKFLKQGMAASTSLKKNFFNEVFKIGNTLAADSASVVAKTGRALLANGLGEAVEETSEELLADFSKACFNFVNDLRGDSTRLDAFGYSYETGEFNMTDLLNRYGLSAVGGFGGGFAFGGLRRNYQQLKRISNMDHQQAIQEIIYRARNGKLDELIKDINRYQLANRHLSAYKYKQIGDSYVLAEGTSDDNLDVAVKKMAIEEINMIKELLDANGGNISDKSFLSGQADMVKGLRHAAIINSSTAGQLLRTYNTTLSELFQVTTEINAEKLKLLDRNGDGTVTDAEESKAKKLTAAERQSITDKISKLEEKKKEKEQYLKDLLEGKKKAEFIQDALFEVSTGIFGREVLSTFTFYAENKEGKKISEIPEARLTELKKEYEIFRQTNSAERTHTLSRLYAQIAERASKLLTQSATEYSQRDQELKKLIQVFTGINNGTFQGIKGIDSYIDYLQSTFEDLATILQTEESKELIGALSNIKNEYSGQLNPLQQQLDQLVVKSQTDPTVKEQIDSLREQISDLKSKEYELAYIAVLSKTPKIIQSILNKYSGQLNQSILSSLSTFVSKHLNEGAQFLYQYLKDNIGGSFQIDVTAAELLNDILKEREFNGEFFPAFDIQGQVVTEYMGESDFFSSENPLAEDVEAFMERYNSLLQQIEESKNNATKLEQVISEFALSIGTPTTINFSQLITLFEEEFKKAQYKYDDMTVNSELRKQAEEMLNLLKLFRMAIAGAKQNAVDLTNLYGYNATLNEIAKTNWAVIDDITADQFLAETELMISKLDSIVRVYESLEGQKLKNNDKVELIKDTILYQKVKLIIQVDDFKSWDGYAEFATLVNSLKLHNELASTPRDLSAEERIEFQKETIELENAIYDLFNNPNNKGNLSPEKLSKLFDHKQLGDSLFINRASILGINTKDIDANTFISWLASRAAVRSSDLRKKLVEVYESDKESSIVPVTAQEEAAFIAFSMVNNQKMLSNFIDAYKVALKETWSSLDIENRLKLMAEILQNDKIRTIEGFRKLAEDPNYLFYQMDLPRYKYSAIIEGMPGTGKTQAVFSLVYKLIEKTTPTALSKVYYVHGASEESAKAGLAKLGLSTGHEAMGRREFMKKIDPKWTDKTGSTEAVTASELNASLNADKELISNNTITAIDDGPTIIFIDEISKFTQIDMAEIEEYCKLHNCIVVGAGDFNQIGCSFSIKGINDPKFTEDSSATSSLRRTHFIGSPKLGLVLRTDNATKTANLMSLQQFIDAKVVDRVPVNLEYSEEEDGLFGDKIIKASVDTSATLDSKSTDELIKAVKLMVDTLKEGQKIIYLYDDPKHIEIYHTLLAPYKDKIELMDIRSAQGTEGQYYITDLKSVDAATLQDSINKLYTGISRAVQGSISIISDLGAFSKITNTKIDRSIRMQDLSEFVRKKFTTTRLDLLKKALEGFEDSNSWAIQRNITNTPPTPDASSTVTKYSNGKDGIFGKDELVETQGDSLYELTLDENSKTGKFTLITTDDIIKDPSSYGEYVETSGTGDTVIDVIPGELELDNDGNWKIKKKAKVVLGNGIKKIDDVPALHGNNEAIQLKNGTTKDKKIFTVSKPESFIDLCKNHPDQVADVIQYSGTPTTGATVTVESEGVIQKQPDDSWVIVEPLKVKFTPPAQQQPPEQPQQPQQPTQESSQPSTPQQAAPQTPSNPPSAPQTPSATPPQTPPATPQDASAISQGTSDSGADSSDFEAANTGTEPLTKSVPVDPNAKKDLDDISSFENTLADEETTPENIQTTDSEIEQLEAPSNDQIKKEEDIERQRTVKPATIRAYSFNTFEIGGKLEEKVKGSGIFTFTPNRFKDQQRIIGFDGLIKILTLAGHSFKTGKDGEVTTYELNEKQVNFLKAAIAKIQDLARSTKPDPDKSENQAQAAIADYIGKVIKYFPATVKRKDSKIINDNIKITFIVTQSPENYTPQENSNPQVGDRFASDQSEYTYGTESKAPRTTINVRISAQVKTKNKRTGEDTINFTDVFDTPIVNLGNFASQLNYLQYQNKEGDKALIEAWTRLKREYSDNIVELAKGIGEILKQKEFKEKYSAIQQLVNIFLNKNRAAVILDNNWYFSAAFSNLGTNFTTFKGHTAVNPDIVYSAESEINLVDLQNDPRIVVTKVYKSIDGSMTGLTTDGTTKTIPGVCHAGHPFVFITDDLSLKGYHDRIIERYFQQLNDGSLEKRVKLVYVLTPEYDILEYIRNIDYILSGDTENKSFIGNLHTSYKMFQKLLEKDDKGNFLHQDAVNLLKIALDGNTGKTDNFDKLVDIIENLTKDGTDIKTKLLKKDKYFGFNSDVTLAGTLDYILYKLMTPDTKDHTQIQQFLNDVLAGSTTTHQKTINNIKIIKDALSADGKFKPITKIYYWARALKGAPTINGLVELSNGTEINDKPLRIKGKFETSVYETKDDSILSMLSEEIDKLKEIQSSQDKEIQKLYYKTQTHRCASGHTRRIPTTSDKYTITKEGNKRILKIKDVGSIVFDLDDQLYPNAELSKMYEFFTKIGFSQNDIELFNSKTFRNVIVELYRRKKLPNVVMPYIQCKLLNEGEVLINNKIYHLSDTHKNQILNTGSYPILLENKNTKSTFIYSQGSSIKIFEVLIDESTNTISLRDINGNSEFAPSQYQVTENKMVFTENYSYQQDDVVFEVYSNNFDIPPVKVVPLPTVEQYNALRAWYDSLNPQLKQYIRSTIRLGATNYSTDDLNRRLAIHLQDIYMISSSFGRNRSILGYSFATNQDFLDFIISHPKFVIVETIQGQQSRYYEVDLRNNERTEIEKSVAEALVAKENTITTEEQPKTIDIDMLIRINDTLKDKGIANRSFKFLLEDYTTEEEILEELLSDINGYTNVIDIIIQYLEADQVEYLNKLKQFMKDNQQNNDSCNPRF